MFFPTTISLLLAINTVLPLGHRELCRTITQVLYILPWFPFQVLSLQTIFKGGVRLYLGMEVEWAWFALILQPFAYFVLYLYFDNVIPNSFGISKECFYCLRCRNSNATSNRMTMQNSRLNESLIERELTDGEKVFDSSDPIKIQSLTKKFGKFTAVDKITMSIKSNEVFTILGHNGAGKTTAIYMLTGMLKPTKGEAILYDNAVTTDIDEVRKDLGLCQ